MSTSTFEPKLDTTPAEPVTASLLARLGAEVFGTFVLVLLGAGTAIYASITGLGAGVLGVGAAFAVAVAAAGVAVQHVSGAHFNPAVTFGAAIAGRTPWADVLPYWLAQLVGASLAGLTLFVVTPSTLPTGLGMESMRDMIAVGANGFGDHSPLSTLSNGQVTVSLVSALLIEIIATAVLVGVVLGVTNPRANVRSAPAFIGIALGALLIVAIPLTNGSLNPARSFGTALFSSSWALSQVWVFVVAPLVGAGIAALAYRLFSAQVPGAVEVYELVTADDAVEVETVAVADVLDPSAPSQDVVIDTVVVDAASATGGADATDATGAASTATPDASGTDEEPTPKA